MIKKLLPILIFFLLLGYSKAQTKVSGRIFDEVNEPLAYATVLFKGSIEGTTSDENGRFYLESSKNWAQLVVSFMGYETLEIELSKKVNFNLKFVLKEEANTLKIFPNPANDLIRIATNTNAPTLKYIIIDVLGIKQLEGIIEIGSCEINTSHLVSGTFFLQLEGHKTEAFEVLRNE